jgi:hypothetical protein
VGKDAIGNTVPITPAVSWSVVAGGGTINATTGEFTAGTTSGTFSNTVKATNGIGGSISNTATVTVNAGALDSIIVTPNPDTLYTGDTQQLLAKGKDANGNVVPLPLLTWLVLDPDAGSITSSSDSTGLFTAGAGNGTFLNKVKASSGSISGTSTVIVYRTGPAIVNLGTAGNFVILAEAGITTTGTTAIVGDVGISPAADTFMGGFGQFFPVGITTYKESSLVTGKIYGAGPDYAAPTPGNLTVTVDNMHTALVNALGRAPDLPTELYAGNLTGQTIPPGTYKWGTDVNIDFPGGLTLEGGANSKWIFQIDQDLILGPGAQVFLAGGALPQNIFWAVSGKVTLDTTVDLKGIILSKTQITMKAGATLKGRALAQTNVTLISNAVTQP